MTGWYRTGTVAVTNGLNTIAGTGTYWLTNGVALGDVFTADFSVFYEVQNITAEGAITLDRNFAGTTASGANYAIIRNFSPLNASLLASVNALVTAYSTQTIPAPVKKFFPGSPAASQIVHEEIFTTSTTFPASLTGSAAKAGTAATASTTFTITKNGSAIGTMVFAASAMVPSFTFASAVTFNLGDVLAIVAPASPDTTLANIVIALLGSIA